MFRKSKTDRLIIAAALLIIAAAPSFAQYEVVTETDVSWQSGDIMIKATAKIPESEINLTSARFRITESIDRSLTGIVTEAFSGIYLDSLHTLSEGFTASQRRLSDFDTLNMSKTRISSSLSLNLDSVTNLYKYNINDELIPILISHDRKAPAPVVLSYEPSSAFSGIVIYAADLLPYYGESERGRLQPAVFPKIFNMQMEPVAAVEMSDPEYLRQWGFVLYTDSLDERQFEQRIGLYPFRTTAEAVFGRNHTDILITDDAARKILYNSANRRLIEQGRILIIIGAE